MSWIIENKLPFYHKFFINIMKCGPIPDHIAFIMDGNRRYASKTNVEKVEGHSKGFEKLAECLLWCRELGIKEVTVYAFSIENFKRKKEEVDALMDLAREKFKKFLEEKEKIMKEGVRIKVIGNMMFLPEDLRKLIAEAVLFTKDNSRSILNIAFSYTARDEIVHSIQSIVNGVIENRIEVDDINEDLISNCLYSHNSPNPNILIRTSGEVRLSDFLLWQISNTDICFKDVLWPEFNIWHLLGCIFNYQISYPYLNKYELEQKTTNRVNERVKLFLEHLREKEIAQYVSFTHI